MKVLNILIYSDWFARFIMIYIRNTSERFRKKCFKVILIYWEMSKKVAKRIKIISTEAYTYIIEKIHK